jgi:SAM-dependent methyltransferase
MMSAVGPADVAGLETLEVMREARRYNAWQYSRIAPYLGARVCEIGSGIGNMSSLILRDRREMMVLTDTDPYYRSRLQSQFAQHANVIVESLTLPDPSAVERFKRYRLDSVVALNVIEHIPDDVGAMRSIAELLNVGGRAIVLVPALEALYGSLDIELEHCRRYTRRVLTDRMRTAGFLVERVFFFNAVGAIGWWANSRLLKRSRISARQLRRRPD